MKKIDIASIKLSDFGISETRGFLPDEDPKILSDLDCYYCPDMRIVYRFQEIAKNLPELLFVEKARDAIRKESNRFLEEVYNRNKKFDIARLFEDRTDLLETAMRIFSFLGNAYVWQGSDWKSDFEPKEVLPKGFAVLWHQIASALGRYPSLAYQSYALHNWRRIDSDGPIDVSNIVLINNFLGGRDENWFVTIHDDIEAKMGSVPKTMLDILGVMLYDDTPGVIRKLKHIVSCQQKMYDTMLRMTEKCIPSIYYDTVRPYIHGWKNNPTLPDGLYYPGVKEYDGTPQKFRGETGAQSSIIPTLDAFFGVRYPIDLFTDYLLEMRDYMPEGHRRFIKTLRSIDKGTTSFYSYIQKRKQTHPELFMLFQESGKLAVQFLKKHFEYAHMYIFSRQQKNEANPTATGTGGTDMMRYLKIHMETRRKHFELV